MEERHGNEEAKTRLGKIPETKLTTPMRKLDPKGNLPPSALESRSLFEANLMKMRKGRRKS